MCASFCVRVVIVTTRTYALLYRGAPPSEFLLAFHFFLCHETAGFSLRAFAPLHVCAFALLFCSRLCCASALPHLRLCSAPLQPLLSTAFVLCSAHVAASSASLTRRARLLHNLRFVPPPDVNAYSRLLVNMRFLCKKSFGQTHRQNRARACVH